MQGRLIGGDMDQQQVSLYQDADQRQWPLTQGVLTLILAFWNRVDYRIRQMTPWLNNDEPRGYLQENTNLFKDYLSPPMPNILWRSLKERDLVVTASGMVANLITLVIVVSTGLLTLKVQPIRHKNIPYSLTSHFTEDEEGMYTLSLNSLPMDTLDAIDMNRSVML
jgi:hypothetical protein